MGKLFAGNLLVQLLQITIVIAMIIYRATDKDLVSIFSFVITVSMIKILEKLEDIVRDASINVGSAGIFLRPCRKFKCNIYHNPDHTSCQCCKNDFQQSCIMLSDNQTMEVSYVKKQT